MQRVLIVEDDVDTREVLTDLLTDEGFEVRAFGDGHAVLGHLARDPDIDVLVVDLHLPGLSGPALLEAIAGLSARLAAVPAVAITGDPLHPHPERAAALLLKPFNVSRLVVTIRDAMSSARFAPTSVAC